MPVVISSDYLQRLCRAREYEGLVWISAALCGAAQFSPDDPAYGLPGAAFEVVERLAWFAQGTRSGAWTYFEATPLERQRAMLTRLGTDVSHPNFGEHYQIGMRDWRTPSALVSVDNWLDANDELNNSIIWTIICANRELVQGLANTDS
jgi:hypothetical protein